MGETLGGPDHLNAASAATLTEPRADAVASSPRHPEPPRPARSCSCGGTLWLVPGRRESRRKAAAVEELVFHCRSCKKLVNIPVTRTQVGRCVKASGYFLLACALGWITWGKMRQRSSILVIGPAAAATGLSLLAARLSLGAFLKGRRNNRRYPLIEPE
jgi:hypothetical protein